MRSSPPHRLLRGLLLASLCCAASVTWAAVAPGAEIQVQLAVAPFEPAPPAESVGLPGPVLTPERVARALADALAARSQVRVVGPDDLGGAVPTSSPSEVRALAEGAGVAQVAMGRLNRGQLGTNLDLVVRSGHSGAVLAEYEVREIQTAGLDVAMKELASNVLRGLGYEPPGAPLPAVAAPAAGPEESGGSLIDDLRSDEPISIESDELEFLAADERRHLVFSRNVRVVQGDVHLRTDRLEAFYSEGATQPDRFVATGGVEVDQGERHARCLEATYLREDQVVVCSGEAVLVQDCDEVRGDRIEFDLDAERVRVVGAASVVIQESCGERP